MPTTYTGSPTGAATPDIAPEPETAVQVNIPIATEGRTVSSIDQAFKALANQISWLKKVQAKASDWAKWIFAFRSAAGHKRFIVDHFGLPSGRIQDWREGWSTGGSISGTVGPVDINRDAWTNLWTDLESTGADLSAASTGADLAAVKTQLGNAANHIVSAASRLRNMTGMSPWRGKTLQTSGASFVIINAPDPTGPTARHRYAALGAGDTLNDFAYLYRVRNANFDDALTPVLEWEMQLESATMGSKLVLEAGFATENAVPTPYGTANDFACFEKTISGNWFARTAAGGVVTGTDTGVAATTAWTRFRIELAGLTAADDGVRAVRFYINGALVATNLTNLPANTAALGPHFSVTNYQGGAHGLSIPVRVGPSHFGSNIYGSDVS